jgi:hypothetical protein
MTQWEYVKGSEADFREAPEWANVLTKTNAGLMWEEDNHPKIGNRWQWAKGDEVPHVYNNFSCDRTFTTHIIAERRKVDSLQSRVNDSNLKEMFDTVQRPAHYNQSGIECIDAIAASMTPAEFQAYLKGNVQKYLWRYQHKNGVEDCRKAQWYLDRLVKELSK